MGVYLVSLKRLGSLCAQHWPRQVASPNTRAVEPPTDHRAGAEAAQAGDTKRESQAAALTLAQLSGASVKATESGGEPLNPGKLRTEPRLLEGDDSGSKALLGLIYRLGCIEAQLTDLTAQVRGVSAPLPTPGKAQPVHQRVGDAGRSELLEQVFHKNLSLREKE